MRDGVVSMTQVQSRARKALREGMAQLSQADVGSALQIFYNLQMLPEVRLALSSDGVDPWADLRSV